MLSEYSSDEDEEPGDLYFPELLYVLQKQLHLKELNLENSKFNADQTERLLRTITEA